MNPGDNPNTPKREEKDEGKQVMDYQLPLRRILRSRTRLIVCFWTLPVYILGLWLLLNQGLGIDTFMFIYMALYAVFALDMAMRRCPRCRNQFFVKTILLNLITRKCMHCELSQSIHGNSAHGKSADK